MLGRPVNDAMVRMVASEQLVVRIDLETSAVADQRRRLVVDAMNVIGSRPTGWWRDRRGAMARLVEELGRYAEAAGEDVTVVLDSDPFDVDAPGLDVRFAAPPATRPTTRSSKWSSATRAGVAHGGDIGQGPGGPCRATSARDTMSAGALRRRLDELGP